MSDEASAPRASRASGHSHEASEPSAAACSSDPHPPAAKKTKRACKWQEEWNMKGSKKGPSFVYCNICCIDFSVVYMK